MATAFVLLHVAAVILRDPPLWDEADYLDWGRRFLIDGAPLTLPQCPGYSLLLGACSLVFGPVGAIRIVAIGSTLAFAGAIGSIAFLVWRSSTARGLATVLALGSAHSLSTIGVHRTAIAILLLGALALASERRKPWGLFVFLLCALGAYVVRPEVVWAAPILPLAMWRLAPGSRPSKKATRWLYVGGVAALVVAATVHAAHDGAARNWLAFQQHYSLYRQPQLSEKLGPSFSPWFDFERVVAIDLPGATSPLGAFGAAPVLVLGFLLANAKAAAMLALSSMAASPRAEWLVLTIDMAIVVLAVSSRAKAKSGRAGVGWFVLAMAVTSVTAVEAVSNHRHVIGLSIALAFLLGLLASRGLAERRFAKPVPVVVAGASLWVGCTATYKEVRYAKDCGYPVSTIIAAIRRDPGGRPLKIAGQCNACFCAYAASSCTEIGPPQGYTAATQCALFEGDADIVALRIEPGAEAAPPCGAVGYRLLGRWPSIEMEVWRRGSAE